MAEHELTWARAHEADYEDTSRTDTYANTVEARWSADTPGDLVLTVNAQRIRLSQQETVDLALHLVKALVAADVLAEETTRFLLFHTPYAATYAALIPPL